ncbi:MAG: hypothetical protein QM503_06620 [Bacteroidota bacterium]
MANASKKRSTARKGTITLKKVTDKVPETLLTVGGLYSGQLLYSVVQKIVEKFVPPQGTTSGLSGVSNIATPVILTVLGIVAPEFVKFGTGGKYSRSLGNGIAVYGAVKSVKEVLGKDVLAGKLKGMGYAPRFPQIAPMANMPRSFPKFQNSALNQMVISN